jgi:hypothetical protein
MALMYLGGGTDTLRKPRTPEQKREDFEKLVERYSDISRDLRRSEEVACELITSGDHEVRGWHAHSVLDQGGEFWRRLDGLRKYASRIDYEPGVLVDELRRRVNTLQNAIKMVLPGNKDYASRTDGAHFTELENNLTYSWATEQAWLNE